MRFRQVHLDFHTSELIGGIGSRFDPAQFQQMLKAGHVDSITVFSKCHHGWAYHPSKVNQTHPNLTFDLLGAQIAAAHEIGVNTPVYLSVGLDEKLARRHPEWLLRLPDEKLGWIGDFMHPGYHEFCLNSPYLEAILSQIAEVLDNYDADGLFLDIVGVRQCWCQNCIASLRSEGLDPRDDAAVRQLGERTYFNYVKRVAEIVNARRPGLPVFHNAGHIEKGRRDIAAYDTHLELESLPTSFWGYDHFPSSALYSAGLGKEYLGMTGKFHTWWGEFGGYKHPNALRYETSLSLALGSKCSIGDQLHPDGHMDERTYALIGAAYAEVEQKEPWCIGSKNIADIGLISEEAHGVRYPGHGQAEGNGYMKLGETGAQRVLLEGHYLFDVLDFQSDIGKYKMLILPDSITLDEAYAAKLAEYVENGGKLLLTGASGLDHGRTKFMLPAGCELVAQSGFAPSYYVWDDSVNPAVIYTRAYDIEPLAGSEVLAKRVEPYFNRDVFSFSSHQHTPYDRERQTPAVVRSGGVMYCGWDIFSDYAKMGSITTKELCLNMIDSLLGGGKSLVCSLGAQGIATLTRQAERNRYIAHLLYASPVKRGQGTEIIEDIPPLYDVRLEVSLPSAPKRAYLAPQETELPVTQNGGRYAVTVGKLDCHQMVVLEM